MTHKRKMIVWIVSIIVLVVVLSIVLTKVIPIYQYRLQGENIQKYEECLKQYQEDTRGYIDADLSIYEESVEKYSYSIRALQRYKDQSEELLTQIDSMYSATRNWPEKYRELYFYTFIAYKYWMVETRTALSTYKTLSNFSEKYILADKWYDIWSDLEKKLENKYYVPEDLEKYKKEMQELLGEEKLPEYVRVQ